MSVIFILVIIGIIVAGLFLAGFIWAVKSGQYDDTYTPSVRMLFDDVTESDIDLKENFEKSTIKEKEIHSKEYKKESN